MIDSSYQVLLNKSAPQTGTSLWLLDDSFPPPLTAALKRDKTIIITNRYHIYAAFAAADIPAHFSDFELTKLPDDITRVYYRVSKEKALTHYLINQAFSLLPIGGELHLIGHKSDGIKTYIDKGGKLFGHVSDQENPGKGLKYAALKKTQADALLLEDKDYERIRPIADIAGLPVYSKPGVFGWNKIDEGSRFLIEQLDKLLVEFGSPVLHALDLGCGYGYIAIAGYHRHESLKDTHFTLTDNNAAALLCAQANLNAHPLSGTVIGDDCGANLEQSFDLILCNPPFHQGFDVSQDLTEHFLKNTHQLLNAHGYALFVVNQFIGIEKKAAAYFSDIKELARTKSFKLVVLSKPKN